MSSHPGYDEATSMGYELSHHEPNNASAGYTKRYVVMVTPHGVIHKATTVNGMTEYVGKYQIKTIHLTVYNEGTASLFSFFRVVKCGIEEISFPHKNLGAFENQILQCIPNEVL